LRNATAYAPAPNGSPDEFQLQIRAGVVLGDGEVHQHRIHPSQLQVLVRLGLAVVEIGGDLLLLQEPRRRRVVERADPAAQRFDLLQSLEAIVVGPRRELQAVDVVRPREAQLPLAIGRHFQAVHGEVEIAALQAQRQLRIAVLDELDLASQLLLQGLDKIDLEADVLPRVLRIFEDVRRAPFRIRAPLQRLGGESGRREEQCQGEKPASLSHRSPPGERDWKHSMKPDAASRSKTRRRPRHVSGPR
jgi:hypothetical protein